jgi:hypothetical protein
MPGRMLNPIRVEWLKSHGYTPSELPIEKQKEFILELLNSFMEIEEISDECRNIYYMMMYFVNGNDTGNDDLLNEAFEVIYGSDPVHEGDYVFREEVLILHKETNILFLIHYFTSSYDEDEAGNDFDIIPRLNEVTTFDF